jgi:DNA-binding winged helix-turn-helix (wHTH) protein
VRYTFASFELDEERYQLRGGGAVIKLQPKVMEVLLHLVRNADRACSKDELIDAVWADVNVSEASLVRCVAVLRRALGETEADASIIQTVRGRGYRIGVPVETGGQAASALVGAPPSSKRNQWFWPGVGTAAALLHGTGRNR